MVKRGEMEAEMDFPCTGKSISTGIQACRKKVAEYFLDILEQSLDETVLVVGERKGGRGGRSVARGPQGHVQSLRQRRARIATAFRPGLLINLFSYDFGHVLIWLVVHCP